MKVRSIQLTDFRGLQHLALDFTQQTTAFVGVNGVGKSTVLDALAIALSQLIWRINEQPARARPIAHDDIRHGADFARIEIVADVHGQTVTWAIVTNRRKGNYAEPERKSDLEALNAAVKALHAEWEHVESERQEPYDLPMAVYYDVNRAVLEVPMRVREKLVHNPNSVYQDALDHGGADFKRFFIWFRNREDHENELRRDDPKFRDRALGAVRAAVDTFTAFSELRIRRSPLRMTVMKQGTELNVAQLSDGERNMLALVGDMARRLSVLNPSLANPNEGKGVALIDEIDLHLHPRWQREVVSKLQRTFPNCQFVISTHSPQVLGELAADSIFLLREGQGLRHPQVSYGLTSSQVLEELMDARARPEAVENKLNSIYENIERSNLGQAKALLAALQQKAPGIPEIAGAEALLRRKEVLGR